MKRHSIEIKPQNQAARSKSLSIASPVCSRFPRISMTARRPKGQNFDKYYIQPQLRYRRKTSNPKQNPQNYQDQTYLYKNLHNNQFWNWAHPLGQYKLKSTQKQQKQKINLSVLQKFKSYMQNKSHQRVPLIVKQMLSTSNQLK